MGVSLVTVTNIIIVFTVLVPDIQAAYLPQELNTGVCEKTITRIVSHIVYVQRKRQECKTSCKTLYYATSETRYKTEVTNVHVCCDGYIDVDGVCTKVDLTTTVDAGDVGGLTDESDEMSTATIVGLGSVIAISIIALVVVAVICVHRRKPKLNSLNKLRRNSSPQYSEANTYTDGYLEPRKSKGQSAIGNVLYKKGLFSAKKEPKRQSNIYTDLKTQTYANKPDTETHDYTMLEESKPPISKLTSYFEGKSEDSSSTEAKLPPGRANTSPIRKNNNHNGQRITSTPLPRTKIKYTTNSDKVSFPEIRLKTGKNFGTSKAESNSNQPKAGVHSLINAFSAKDEQQAATTLSGKTNPIKSGYNGNKVQFKPHTRNASGQNKGMNLSKQPRSTVQGTPNFTRPSEVQKPLISKGDARSILMRKLGTKTAALPTMADDPPVYEDINFYEDI